jgi:hypothetical protein
MIICYSRASYQGVTFYRAYRSYDLQDLATGKRLYDSTSLNCPICQAEIDKFCTKIEQAKDNLGNLLQRERERVVTMSGSSVSSIFAMCLSIIWTAA